MAPKRVGIMTGGGDCPGLNPVIRAVVKVGLQRYNWEVFGIEDAFMGLVDLDYRSPHGNRWLKDEDVRGLLVRGGTILGTSNRSDPFNYAVERDGKTVAIDISDQVMENYRKVGLDCIISIGGDGSMDIAQRFIEKGMNIVGVPKTIDNDLGATDRTFGFSTAVQTATEAVDRVRDTAESHDRVMLVEVMGRHAGWIALHAGMAGGAHAILIPEIPYRLQPIADLIKRRGQTGEPYSVIVVAEGAKPAAGSASIIAGKIGAMPRLMGAAHRVAAGLEEMVTTTDFRVTVLGHIQRGGTPTSFDRLLATRFGVKAAELVHAEEYGKMVSLSGTEIIGVPITDAIDSAKLVDPKSQIVEAARAVGVIFGDEYGNGDA